MRRPCGTRPTPRCEIRSGLRPPIGSPNNLISPSRGFRKPPRGLRGKKTPGFLRRPQCELDGALLPIGDVGSRMFCKVQYPALVEGPRGLGRKLAVKRQWPPHLPTRGPQAEQAERHIV